MNSDASKFLVTLEYEVAHPVWWLATLTAVPLGLRSNPGEDMDVCKCIVPSRHGGSLNSRRAASPLVRLMEGKRGGRPLTTPGFSPSKLE
ncbi:uncharacterized protein TNCV_1018781 [Trichonephila clavipes]|nr:uncharacterized protein TNCV_1018781 [Trichonephila clavipes]